MNLRAIPTEAIEINTRGSVWVIAGQGWREHVSWRVGKIMDDVVGLDAYWMGSGRIGNRFPPSGILMEPRKDITRLVKQWMNPQEPKRVRLILIEDPQGAGIWDDVNRSPAWRTLLENATKMLCTILIGTDVGIPRAGLLLEYADWFVLRSGGGRSAVEDLTSGTASLGGWLDGVGRDVFDDIRVYRRILDVMSNHGKDVVLWLSNESDSFTDRVYWWDPSIEKKQTHSSLYSSSVSNVSNVSNHYERDERDGGRRARGVDEMVRRDRNPEEDGAVAMTTSRTRLVRKLRLVIGLLEEVCDELDEDKDSDEE